MARFLRRQVALRYSVGLSVGVCDDSGMSLHLNTITVDCTAWEPLVAFWSQVGDFAEMPDNPNQAGDPEGLLRSAENDIELLFIPVPEPKQVKNRMHLDLSPNDGSTRDEEVERLLSVGATMYADHRRADGSGFVVLTDPEGNEFCVERSISAS
jgi:hypothetical protein